MPKICGEYIYLIPLTVQALTSKSIRFELLWEILIQISYEYLFLKKKPNFLPNICVYIPYKHYGTILEMLLLVRVEVSVKYLRGAFWQSRSHGWTGFIFYWSQVLALGRWALHLLSYIPFVWLGFYWHHRSIRDMPNLIYWFVLSIIHNLAGAPYIPPMAIKSCHDRVSNLPSPEDFESRHFWPRSQSRLPTNNILAYRNATRQIKKLFSSLIKKR